MSTPTEAQEVQLIASINHLYPPEIAAFFLSKLGKFFPKANAPRLLGKTPDVTQSSLYSAATTKEGGIRYLQDEIAVLDGQLNQLETEVGPYFGSTEFTALYNQRAELFRAIDKAQHDPELICLVDPGYRTVSDITEAAVNKGTPGAQVLKNYDDVRQNRQRVMAMLNTLQPPVQ